MMNDGLDFTGSALDLMYGAVDDAYFRDRDAELIYKALENGMKAIPFYKYLKRYIYRKAELEGDYNLIPIKDYQLIIREAFADNNTPPSFVPTSAKLSALSKNWLSQQTVKRGVVFLLGFGLNMSVDDVNDFLTKALREPGINFKDPFEIICWYCYKNHYNYLKFEKLWQAYQDMPAGMLDMSAIYLDRTVGFRQSAGAVHDDASLLAHLSRLKTDNNRSKLSVTARLHFDRLYDAARDAVAEIHNSDEESTRTVTREDITPSDIEHVICAAIPLDRHGNLMPVKLSKFNEHFHGKKFSRQHVSEILAGEAEIERFDLITLNFFVYSQNLDEHPDRKNRYISFVDSTNDMLYSCGMGELYVANPYECFILMCILAEDPLGTYADVWEMSYEKE